MCNSFGVYFQIFKTFGYMKLKNSDWYRNDQSVSFPICPFSFVYSILVVA